MSRTLAVNCSDPLVLEHALTYLPELYSSHSLAFPCSPQSLVTTVCLFTSVTSISFSITNEWEHIVFVICVWCVLHNTMVSNSTCHHKPKDTSKKAKPGHEELYLCKLISSASATSCYLLSRWWLIFNMWIKELHCECSIPVALSLWLQSLWSQMTL